MVQLKVGDKVKGFKFERGEAMLTYNPDMEQFEGQKGIVSRLIDNCVIICYLKPFERCWSYPLNHPLAKPVFKIQNKLK